MGWPSCLQLAWTLLLLGQSTWRLHTAFIWRGGMVAHRLLTLFRHGACLPSLCLAGLQSAFWMWSGARQTSRMRTKYLKAALRQDISFFDVSTSTGGRAWAGWSSGQRSGAPSIWPLIDHAMW